MRKIHIFATVAVALFFTSAASHGEPLQIPQPKQADFYIAIHCSLNLLQLWRSGELVREYPVETGKGGLGKKTSGDHKTPIGDYEISWTASKISRKGHKIIDSVSWCKGNKFVHSPTGPSLEKLWAQPYGGDEATIMSINYPNEKETGTGIYGGLHPHPCGQKNRLRPAQKIIRVYSHVPRGCQGAIRNGRCGHSRENPPIN